MRVFSVANIEGNTGPANANRAFFQHWPTQDEVRVLAQGNVVSKVIGSIRGALWCDVLFASETNRVLKIASPIVRLRRKVTCAFCHGWLPYENEVNDHGFSEKDLQAYTAWLDSVDVVATNSSMQKEFIVREQRSLDGKVESTTLGVVPFDQRTREPRGNGKLVVAVSGGSRPIKGNEVVARAVRKLRAKGMDAELRVYGNRYAKNAELDAILGECGRYMGQVDEGEFVQGLFESDVFVMNSRREPFGLSAYGALEAGCSLVLSGNCGIAEVLSLKPEDIVNDCEDADEVAEKIVAAAENPNGERIYRALDFSAVSWQAASKKLRDICANAVAKKGEKRV